MKIGIIGYGFVGKALDNALHESVDVIKVDPKLNSTIEDLKEFSPYATFVCLPTPMKDDGSQDISTVEEVFLKIKELNIPGLIILKSTVHPGNITKLEKILYDFVYNPEFLREKHANLDFVNSDMIIFGGDRNISTKVSDAYLRHSRCKTKEHIFTDLKTASLIKYAINTFLASKVIFFNELNLLYEKLDVKDSWESIINIISKDKRIGESHMNVPGHDGKKGFGGACFPKDSLALAKYANEIGADLSILKEVILKNNKIRIEYKDLDQRELEQNVSFKKSTF